MSPFRPIGTLAAERSVIVCCGAGGVGKTTAAAAIALGAARAGRRACVVTIDPARRLADALGLEGLSNSAFEVAGDWPGQLWALMLDTKGTFDDLVRSYAPDTARAESILHNRLYRNISTAISGTQEYMAAEKLFELHTDERFDLVVVDTPPSRNALDFLDAPGRLTRLLENRIFRLLVLPTRTYLRAVSIGVRTFLRSVSSVVGSDVVDDTVAFFQAFEGMEEGFRQRAEKVRLLLADRGTAFVLVTAPRSEAVEEGIWFVEKLAAMGLRAEAVVVNRTHPHFAPTRSELLTRRPNLPRDMGPLLDNLADLELAATQEDAVTADLLSRTQAAVQRVPLLEEDVHDLEGIGAIAGFLM